MPAYGTPQAGYNAPPNEGLNLTSVVPGESLLLWNAESPADGTASVAFVRGYNPGGGGSSPIVFQASWATGAAGVVTIQGSNTDVAADYVNLGAINANGGYYADAGGFEFYRAVSTTGNGNAVTVKVQR